MTMDNDGNNAQYATLDEMAGVKGAPEGARGMAEMVRAVLIDGTDLALTEVQIAAPVALLAGTAMVVTALDSQGIEYEIFIRERQN